MRLMTILLMLLVTHTTATTVKEWTADYDTFLNTYVVKSTQGRTVVTAFKYDAARRANATVPLRKGLASISNLQSQSKDEQLAFWLNAYNFLAIDTAIRNPSIEKLTDLNRLFKSVWKQDAGTVAGKTMSLDQIEHGLIRKQFSEPRIHVALVCAAHSCPNLRWEAYVGSKLETQLDEQLKQFISNKTKGLRIDAGDEDIYLSKIFKWFDEDFPGGPVPWLVKQGVLDKRYQRYDVEYLDYDWTLNAAK